MRNFLQDLVKRDLTLEKKKKKKKEEKKKEKEEKEKRFRNHSHYYVRNMYLFKWIPSIS